MEEHPSWRDANMCAPTPVLSLRAIRLSAPGRSEDIQARISAPATGENLPIILFSHGYGSSMDGYAPLTDYWAAHGFVVIQPTHLDAKRLGLAQDDPTTADLAHPCRGHEAYPGRSRRGHAVGAGP
jgi:predicted dienelactone hydrolase